MKASKKASAKFYGKAPKCQKKIDFAYIFKTMEFIYKYLNHFYARVKPARYTE